MHMTHPQPHTLTHTVSRRTCIMHEDGRRSSRFSCRIFLSPLHLITRRGLTLTHSRFTRPHIKPHRLTHRHPVMIPDSRLPIATSLSSLFSRERRDQRRNPRLRRRSRNPLSRIPSYRITLSITDQKPGPAIIIPCSSSRTSTDMDRVVDSIRDFFASIYCASVPAVAVT